MKQKKHTIDECKLRYESNTEYSLNDISDWSGYSIQHIKRMSSKDKWQKGLLKLKETAESLKRNTLDNIEMMLEFKNAYDSNLMDNAKSAYIAIGNLNLVDCKNPTFEELKCRKILTEIAYNTYKLLGLLEEKPDDNKPIEVVITNDHE